MRTFFLLLFALLPTPLHAQEKEARISPEGRLLYANDDDWDWASSMGGKEPCGLAIYGEMSWSALDWLEEGLPEVRGMLIGEPPNIGKYLTMADLNRVRRAGPKRGYDQRAHQNNLLRDLLSGNDAPNVVILMQDSGPVRPPFSREDVEAVWSFVKRGGRLLILDDWQCYHEPMAPFLDAKRVKPRKVGPRDPMLVKAVEARVRLLGDESFKVRDRAFQELVKLGPDILPILDTVRPETLEATRRLERIQEILRPPLTILAGGDWMIAASKVLQELHPHCEIKAITRDGPKLPGAAVCIRMPKDEPTLKKP